jgi:hypothetical protein
VATLILASVTARAVSPLITDDADTVEPGHLQFNAGWDFTRTGSIRIQSVPMNPVVGVHARGEVGLTFGYEWRDDETNTPTPANANGFTDLLGATKWKLWVSDDEGFKVSAHLEAKLPTASEHQSLGTGKVDLNAALIATRCWGKTCVDANVGYNVMDASRADFGDDSWFLGLAVRNEVDAHWTLIGEVFGVLPQSGSGGSANGSFRGGIQFKLSETFLLSALVGSAAGKNSPDLTGFIGFTARF